MAFQFDGNGQIIIPQMNESGDFSITTPPIEYKAGLTQVILGRDNDTTSLLAILDGGIVRLKVNNATLDTVGSLQDGEYFTCIASRVGTTVSLEVVGYGTNTMTESGNMVLDRIGAANGNQLNFTGKINNGTLDMSGDNTAARSYDFSPSTGTALTELNGGTSGTLSSFTTGGFVSGSSAVANAGVDQSNIVAGVTVTLDGSQSQNAASYSWSQTSGTTVTLSDATAESPTFTAPSEGSGQTLIFELTVTGADASTSTDSVDIGVLADGQTGPDPVIAITSLVDYQFKSGGVNKVASFDLSGSIDNLPSGAYVEYQIDNSDWLPLDANPTTSFSGSVQINGQQTVRVRLSNRTDISDEVVGITAAFPVIFASGQSNEAGRVNSLRPVEVDAGKPIPLMYKQGVYSALADPVGYDTTTKGSTWPGIVSLLTNNDDYLPAVCNVAEGGTSWSRWRKDASDLYPRITAAGNNVGAPDLVVTLIGETDSGLDRDTADIKADIQNWLDGIQTDYGETPVCFTDIPKTAYNRPEQIREAYDEVIIENAFCYEGGDLSVIDISDGDGTHLQTAAHVNAAYPIRYTAFSAALDSYYGESNQPPTANEPDLHMLKYIPYVTPGKWVRLDAGGVTRGIPVGGLKIKWTQTAGTPVKMLSADTLTPSFKAPVTGNKQTLVFTLEATNYRGAVSTATINIPVDDNKYVQD